MVAFAVGNTNTLLEVPGPPSVFLPVTPTVGGPVGRAEWYGRKPWEAWPWLLEKNASIWGPGRHAMAHGAEQRTAVCLPHELVGRARLG